MEIVKLVKRTWRLAKIQQIHQSFSLYGMTILMLNYEGWTLQYRKFPA